MTQTFGTNANNDLYVAANGNLALLSGEEAVSAACATVSKSLLGEMVLATGAGLPNFQAVWTGVPNLIIWKQYLFNALKSVLGVRNVTDITVTPQQNVLSYTATIESNYGRVALSDRLSVS